jgi:hypothetical protein
MPTKESRAEYMRAYRAKKGATRGRPRSTPPTKGQKKKIVLQDAWKLGCRELADLGTPIHVQLNRSRKITLKAKFPGALAHALVILSGYRTGRLSWMYELLCAAVFPDSICRSWKTLHPAFWMKKSALMRELDREGNA